MRKFAYFTFYILKCRVRPSFIHLVMSAMSIWTYSNVSYSSNIFLVDLLAWHCEACSIELSISIFFENFNENCVIDNKPLQSMACTFSLLVVGECGAEPILSGSPTMVDLSFQNYNGIYAGFSAAYTCLHMSGSSGERVMLWKHELLVTYNL